MGVAQGAFLGQKPAEDAVKFAERVGSSGLYLTYRRADRDAEGR